MIHPPTHPHYFSRNTLKYRWPGVYDLLRRTGVLGFRFYLNLVRHYARHRSKDI
jgi:hypothetical protein